jgi:hypothetical protein
MLRLMIKHGMKPKDTEQSIVTVQPRVCALATSNLPASSQHLTSNSSTQIVEPPASG